MPALDCYFLKVQVHQVDHTGFSLSCITSLVTVASEVPAPLHQATEPLWADLFSDEAEDARVCAAVSAQPVESRAATVVPRLLL